MRCGSAGLGIIKEFESCRLSAYLDQKGIPTIGWGHTGPEVHLGLVWTQAQADEQLAKDVQSATLGVIKNLDVAIGQNAFDALVSFTYNVGVDAEAHSTLLRLVNAGQLAAAATHFVEWDHTNGQENAGLLRRRKAERELFLTPDSPAPVASA